MTFRNDFQKSSARAERRSGGGRAIAVGGGGIGGLVLIGLYLLLGGDPGQLGQLTGAQNNQSSQTAQ